MKLNWGHNIVIIFSLFVLMIGYFAYRSIKEGFDLVSPDYYDKEVKYQQQINSMQNTLTLQEKPATGYNKANEMIEIKFPSTIDAALIGGEINFFKPDNASLDFTVKIKLGENNMQMIDTKKIANGSWRVKTTWTNNGVAYYQEENIFID